MKSEMTGPPASRPETCEGSLLLPEDRRFDFHTLRPPILPGLTIPVEAVF
jgi:hypothetical protein